MTVSVISQHVGFMPAGGRIGGKQSSEKDHHSQQEHTDIPSVVSNIHRIFLNRSF